MSCRAKESPLYSALFFQRANKEANVAAEASYVVMIEEKWERKLRLKMLHANIICPEQGKWNIVSYVNTVVQVTKIILPANNC